MGNRIVLCGELHLSREAFERAQDTGLLEFFYEDPDDEVSFHPKAVTARTLFSAEERKYRKWARNSYDGDTGRWTFGASIHDDNWANADPEMLTRALAALKDRDGSDVVAAFVEWSETLDGAWRIDQGRVTAFAEPPSLPDAAKEHLWAGKIEQAVAGLRALLALP
jgi:hypothetical protein